MMMMILESKAKEIPQRPPKYIQEVTSRGNMICKTWVLTQKKTVKKKGKAMVLKIRSGTTKQNQKGTARKNREVISQKYP
ncbi:hypothetical protein ElyMa_006153300, partial [Elysia marginata]